jgi:hypothetical protein
MKFSTSQPLTKGATGPAAKARRRRDRPRENLNLFTLFGECEPPLTGLGSI